MNVRWVMAAVLCGLTIGCSDGGIGDRGDPVRIGVIVSLTGDLGPVGPHLVNAAQLVERDVAAAGGVLGGRRLQLLIGDDRTEPARAGRLAQEMIDEEGVVGIVGGLASTASLEIQQVCAERQVPQVSCCSTSPDLTMAQPERDRYFFRTVPSDLKQAFVVARHAQSLSCERLAIMHLDDAYGVPFGQAIEQEFSEVGGTVVGSVSFAPERPSYSAEVASVAGLGPDCVALVAFTVSGGTILRDWNTLSTRPDVTWIGTDGIKDAGFVEAAGDAALVDGVRGTSPITDPGTRESNAYAANYESRYREPPGIFGGNQYDATALLVLAIARAGSTNGQSIRDGLFRVASPSDGGSGFFGPHELAQAFVRLREGAEIDYNGASGPVDFDTYGDVVSNYEIWEYRADPGTFVSIEVIQASEIQ